MAECCSSTRGQYTCQLDAPHPKKRHKHESDDGVLGTWVVTWVTDDLDTQPPYPEGPVELERCVASREDFTG